MTICAALATALCTANADVKRASEKMTIDGRLDEPCWAAADWNGDFVRLASSVKDRSSRGAFWSRTTSGEPVSGHGTTPAWRPSVRWRGFNLLGMFCRTKMEDGDKRIFGYFPEDRFKWMEEWGFNFARLPLDDGTFIFAGEIGCHQGNVPHATYLAWLEDTLMMCERHGWGWALWNLDGTFGILDTPRTDCEFEDFHGHKLDRKALELLRRH